MTALDPIVSSILPGVVTGLVTAAFSVWLALRRFRSERIWERKVHAYTDVFDALFHVKAYTKAAISRIEQGGQLDSEYMTQLGARAAAGYEAIRKAVVMGTLVLGSEATRRLGHLEKVFDDPHYNDDPLDELAADLEAVTNAIDELRPIASRDLLLD